jgi:predicted PurR-regulated permease PerM
LTNDQEGDDAMTSYNPDDYPWVHPLLDVILRIGLIVVLAIYCFGVFHPFLNLMLWSVILAVTLYPLHRKLRAKIGKDGRTATLIVLASIALLAVPVWVIGNSLIDTATESVKAAKGGGAHVEIPPPPAAMQGWPLVGPKLHEAWTRAHDHPEELKAKLGPKIKDGVKGLLSALANVASGLMLFLVAMPVAGIFMAWGEESALSARRICSAFVGPARGPGIAVLCTSTIRAVAQGVIGIAFIQAVLVGIAIVPMGIPGAGLLCLAVLMLGIMQVPVALLTIPIIIWVLATQGASGTNIIFSIYLFIAGLADNVLKPLMLGRGVSVPMPVVLIGAIGGMVTNGLLGLFIGPVALGVAYELFWRWVDERAPDAPATAEVLASSAAANLPQSG